MAQTQPNVIWVLTDQQRAMMLSCNGDPNVHTPNIDALADMGVNVTRAVSGYPLCCPFRGSMLTSRYPHECVPGREYQMPPEMPTIADVFNENGYHTAYFGQVAPGRLPRAGGARGPAHGTRSRPSGAATSSSGWGMRTTTASTTAGSTAGRARRPFAAGCRDTRRTA